MAEVKDVEFFQLQIYRSASALKVSKYRFILLEQCCFFYLQRNQKIL